MASKQVFRNVKSLESNICYEDKLYNTNALTDEPLPDGIKLDFLDKHDIMMYTLKPELISLRKLMYHREGLKTLDDADIKQIMENIDILKKHNIWNVHRETEALESVKKSIELSKKVRMLPPNEKMKYRAKLMERMEDESFWRM